MTLFDTFDFLGRKKCAAKQKNDLVIRRPQCKCCIFAARKGRKRRIPPRSPLKLLSRKSSYYSLAAQTTTSTAVKLLLPRTAQAQQRSRYNIRPPPGHLPIPTPLNIKSNLYPTPPPEPARNVNMLKSVLILP